jgi:hypothetical protein
VDHGKGCDNLFIWFIFLWAGKNGTTITAGPMPRVDELQKNPLTYHADYEKAGELPGHKQG